MKRLDKASVLGLMLAGTVVAGAGLGVAWMTRGPDSALMPEMMPEMVVSPIEVAPGQDLWVQRYEVSVAEWNACHAAGGCAQALTARPDQTEQDTPATSISYMDALEYVSWITGATGHAFRLPSVAEWTALAHEVLPETPDPIFTDPALSWASAYLLEAQVSRALRPRGSFSVTADGIADLDGSVWEWTQDCYAGAGSERGSAPSGTATDCPAAWVAGEHIAAMSVLERDPARGGCAVGTPPVHLGLRLVSDTRPPTS